MTTKTPKVSVLCLTYNQEKYIRQTLDGFLLQKTNFIFEVLINDDASTDKTVEIIKEYADKHPDIIKPIFQKENLYSQGFKNFIPRFLIPEAKGQYLAVCEGDDYWTDPKKLQTQADFLDSHPEHTVCFHPVDVIYEKHERENFVFPDVEDQSWYTTGELLKTNYIPTNAVMYRKLTYKKYPLEVSPGDWFFHLYHASFGKIGFINKTMSVYRKHTGGIFWEYDFDADKIWRIHGIAHLKMQQELLKLYGDTPEYSTDIHSNIRRLLERLIALDEEHGDGLLVKAISDFPEFISDLLMDYHKKIVELQKAAAEKDKALIETGDKLWSAIHEQNAIIKQKDQEIKRLKSSRVVKARNSIAKSIGKKTI